LHDLARKGRKPGAGHQLAPPALLGPVPRPAGASTGVAAQPRLWCVVLHRVFQLEVVESRCSLPPAAATGVRSGARCRLGLESREDSCACPSPRQGPLCTIIVIPTEPSPRSSSAQQASTYRVVTHRIFVESVIARCIWPTCEVPPSLVRSMDVFRADTPRSHVSPQSVVKGGQLRCGGDRSLGRRKPTFAFPRGAERIPAPAERKFT
jgi:hypothetical protein